MEEYVRQAQNGDKQAFVVLIEQMKQDMYKIAISYLHHDEDAADAIQETILKCYEKLITLKEPTYFKTWLIRILINQCIEIQRGQKRYGAKENLQELLSGEEMIHKQGESEEFKKFIHDMREKYSIILILYYGKELKIYEIAKILGISENTVKTRLARGRKEYKKQYVKVHSMDE
ncbi:MAG: sigma-70 family RNA polymerase sigma factor [Eubacteriales bacterium]